MRMPSSAAAEIFSVADVARAAGVSFDDAETLIQAAEIQTVHGYVRAPDAVRSVRLLRSSPAPRMDLFTPPTPGDRSTGAALAASGGVHVVIALAVALLSWSVATTEQLPERLTPSHLVFLATPGPGGGGGGGGMKQPRPPARAEMKSAAALRSPVPPPRPQTSRKPEPEVRRTVPPPVRPAPAPVEPPPPAPQAVTPQVVAPVVTASSDPRDRAGVPSEHAPETESQGSGTGGGAGTGQGTGLGEGSGSGIGPGSGGGTGGGPYRPGSGITPPQLLREVKPDYTEDARRQGIEGDVVLEIVVRSDGSVGDVRMIRGLGAGLDRRAIDAVRQWRFSPARRFGTPVDVMVEVAVEFKLR
jgi:TonB family protein